jgi:glycerol-1-phosphate dehydrogenase [NAD(P)+]
MILPRERTSPADDPLAALLRGDYVDAETGRPVGVQTKSLAIEDTLAGREADLVTELGFGGTLAVVSDRITHEVLGRRVERALDGRHKVVSILLDRDVHPDQETVDVIRAATGSADAFIAVGSGTINDLTKYASASAGKPYAVFGTAPSMNGYTSLTASITQHGHKLTLPAQAPAGAFFDLGVLAAAPARMIRAGLGDSICRNTAQADWLLSHLLFGTDYRQLPFDLLVDDEAQLIELAKPLIDGDLAAMRVLVRVLVLSGFGTAIVGSSAPASQGEHLISHYIDMMGDPSRPSVLHGEQIGVTTLSIARLYDRMLEQPPVVKADTTTQEEMRAIFGDELLGSVWPEFALKRLDAAKAETLNARLATEWDDICGRIEELRLPTATIEAVLREAGGPLTPEAIHLERSFYEQAVQHGREIRNRYTILDLAAQSGRLDPHSL